jgi:hypothetical protein
VIKQFVDAFKTREYGFNFFPVLGLIIASLLSEGVRVIFFALKSLAQPGRMTIYHPNPINVFYPLFFGLCLVWLAQVINDDSLFPVFFGLAYVVIGLLNRLIGYGFYGYGNSFYENIRLSAHLFNVRSLTGSFFYALVVALGLVILYIIFKRLDYAILLAFPAGEVLSSLFYMAANVVTGGKLYFEADWFFLSLIEGVLSGLFFYLGYVYYMRARGWRVRGAEFRPTGEETTPQTKLLSKKFYAGFLSASILLDLIFLFLILSFYNFRRMQFRPEGATLQGHWLEGFIIPILVLAVLNLLFSAVIYVLFILRMWTALQDGRAGTSPAMAAGFLFIPVFNLYWLFKVFYGFAQDHNALVDRHRLNVPKRPAGLYLVLSILSVANVLTLPLYGLTDNWAPESVGFAVLILISILQAAVALAVVYLTCQAVNRIPAAIYSRGPAAGASGPFPAGA